MNYFADFWKTCKRQLAARTFRQGLFSLALIALVLAIVIALNLLLTSLPTIYTSFDLTEKKQNEELSVTTKDYISALSRDISVYYLVVPGAEDARVSRVLERYAALSGKLHIETVNPELHPEFATSLGITEDLTEGSFVVVSDLRATAIPYTDYYIDVSTLSFAQGIYTYEGAQAFADAYDLLYQTFSAKGMTQSEIINTMASMTYSQYKQAVDGTIPENIMNLEAELTTAIDFVNLEQLSTVYQITGHGETALNQTLANAIIGENVALKSLNLLETTEIPADCNALVICAPTAKYGEVDLAAVKNYLAQGGHLVLLSGDYTAASDLYDMLASEYGVTMLDGIVFDASRKNGNAAHVIPLLGEHAGINANFSGNLNLLMFRARGLSVTARADVTVTPLLKSSADAWFRPTSSKATELSVQEGDTPGTYNYAVAIEKGDTQIAWLGSASLANVFTTDYSNDLNAVTSGGNYQYVLSAILWNVDRSGSLTMEAAGMTYAPRLLVPSTMAALWLVILAILIPVAVIAFGVVRTAKRRAR